MRLYELSFIYLEIEEGLKGNQSYIQKLCDLLYFGI